MLDIAFSEEIILQTIAERESEKVTLSKEIVKINDLHNAEINNHNSTHVFSLFRCFK